LNPADQQRSSRHESLKAYLDLCRVSNLPTIWTNVLAAVVLSGANCTIGAYIALVVSMSCYYMGGMCLNDIWDSAFDRVHNPGRPIPSQRLSLRGAWTMTVILFGAGLLILLLTPFRIAMLAGIILLCAIVFYDQYHKNQPWSVLVMGACRFLVFAVSSLAVAGKVLPAVLVAGSAQFIYVLLLSVTSRIESRRKPKRSFALIPAMIAAISLLDGVVMAVLADPVWLLAGFIGAFLTLAGQHYVRGD
jgi:4-hydroxybenzoate polyprenyltransferase